jgi:hypothetical protein
LAFRYIPKFFAAVKAAPPEVVVTSKLTALHSLPPLLSELPISNVRKSQVPIVDGNEIETTGFIAFSGGSIVTF